MSERFPEGKLYSLDEVVSRRLIPLTKSTLYKYACSKKIRFHKIGNRLFLSERTIKQFLESCEVEAIQWKKIITE